MTRVNSAIPVKLLTDEHLLAEHREIKRLPYNLSSSLTSGSINKLPKDFCLGKGHVLFFVDKIKFIHHRYLELYHECLNRGFNVSNYNHLFEDLVSTKYYNDYIPTEQERLMLVDRISERIKNSNKSNWHYYSCSINKNKAIKLLNS